MTMTSIKWHRWPDEDPPFIKGPFAWKSYLLAWSDGSVQEGMWRKFGGWEFPDPSKIVAWAELPEAPEWAGRKGVEGEE